MSEWPARANAIVRNVLLITLYAVSGVFPNGVHEVIVEVIFIANAPFWSVGNSFSGRC